MTGESLGSILRRIKAQRESEGAEPAHRPDTEAPSRSQTPACSACNDRGWLTPSVPVGHPEFGKTQPCTCQQQRLEDDKLRRLRLYSNLGHMERFTFEFIDEERVDPDNANLFRVALDAALAYAQTPSGWLIFDGPPGSGKTHLAASIANQLITYGLPVLFVSASDLLDELRSGYAPNNPMPFSEIYQRVSEADMLVLDALGSHSTTPWAQEKLHQLINHRFNATLPTVVTLSCPLEDLDPCIL
ncbi:MAG: AAA family ATPase [Chloroflexi bacterium]|nr:AAA family ATPase [Chloroflexota bacterium]